MNLDEAAQLYAGERRRAQFSANGDERYGREIERFIAHVGGAMPVTSVGPAECRSYIDTFDNHAPATVALEHTILSSFFRFLALDDVIEVSPMLKVRRPRVPAAKDRKRTRISSAEVGKLLAACETWPERMCLNTLALTGVRRTALSNLRWADVDGTQWTATFVEKGSKRITKPVPVDLRRVWTRYAIALGPFSPEEWVVPNRGRVRSIERRSSRVIYCIVKDVASRVGIACHVHSFRAAFAVHFLRNNPANLEALRQILGHANIATTQGYLTELEGQDAMGVVKDLTFRVEQRLAAAA